MTEDILSKLGTVTITYRGANGNRTLENVKAGITVGEAVLIYFHDRVLLIPWRSVVEISQPFDENAKQMLRDAMEKAEGQKNEHEPMVG